MPTGSHFAPAKVLWSVAEAAPGVSCAVHSLRWCRCIPRERCERSVPASRIKSRTGARSGSAPGSWLEVNSTGRAALDLVCCTGDDHGVLAELDSAQQLVEAELAQHG